MKGFLNYSVTYLGLFQLPQGFQPSTNFAHTPQVKAFDGDAGAQVISHTQRRGTPNNCN